jgi:membrane-bound ClpP family serine protease
MEVIAWFVLQVLDVLTLGWLSRGARGERPPALDEDREQAERDAMVGRSGTAFTPLRPSGRIELDGRHHEAVSEGRFIDAGATVEVVGWSGFALIVRERQA